VVICLFVVVNVYELCCIGRRYAVIVTFCVVNDY
jgi:hypothetical protein